jgi:hypothetical protein
MKFKELSEPAKINAEQQVYERMLTMDEYKQLIAGLIKTRTEKYIFDKNGNIEFVLQKNYEIQ